MTSLRMRSRRRRRKRLNNRECYNAVIRYIGEDQDVAAVIALGYGAADPQMPKRSTVQEIARFY